MDFSSKFHEKEVLHMLLALRFCHLIISLTAYLTNDLEDEL